MAKLARIRVTDNIYLDEVICPEIYRLFGESSIRFMDVRVVMAWQYIREITGKPVHFNNWWNGGDLDERGLRLFTTKTGAKYSMHKYGNALDGSVEGMTSAQVHDLILDEKNQTYFIQNGMITRLEDLDYTPTWVHTDNAFTGLDNIQIIKP